MNARLDRIGTVTSLTCAIHCAVMHFLLALLPAAFGASLGSEWVEWCLFGGSAVLGLTCMHRGGKVHRRGATKAIFAVGLAMLALGRMLEERDWGVVAFVMGGATVALAHAVNARLCRACTVCHNSEGVAV